MDKSGWAEEFERRALFFDECAALDDTPRVRGFFERRARRRRWDAMWVRLGVPGAWLDLDFRPKLKFDQALLSQLVPPLTQYAHGEIEDAEIKAILMRFFDMPMPVRRASQLSEYLDNELASLKPDAADIQLSANRISSMIETERHDYAYRISVGWPERPCPWGGDELESELL